MKLSILIPSKRPALLRQFINSLIDTADNFSSIELVILEDTTGSSLVSRDVNIVRILYPKTDYVSELNYECYKYATGNWIMFGNDDLIMETPHWDSLLREQIAKYPDQIAMFYPNDTIFKKDFPCFPIISRKALEITDFFNLIKFKKYKVDDSIIKIMPGERIKYLPNIVLKHLNIIDVAGEVAENQWGYKFVVQAGNDDHEAFTQLLPELSRAKDKLRAYMASVENLSVVKC